MPCSAFGTWSVACHAHGDGPDSLVPAFLASRPNMELHGPMCCIIGTIIYAIFHWGGGGGGKLSFQNFQHLVSHLMCSAVILDW